MDLMRMKPYCQHFSKLVNRAKLMQTDRFAEKLTRLLRYGNADGYPLGKFTGQTGKIETESR